MSELPLKTNLDQYLITIGRNIAAFRQKVLYESSEQFAQRLDKYGFHITPATLTDIEAGSGEAPFSVYLAIFDIMQVLDSVTDNMHNNAAIYLSNLEHPINIEEHIKKALNPIQKHG